MKLITCAIATAAVLLTGCATPPGSRSSASVTPPATQVAAISMPDGPGRDWTKVDTNGDNLVSPEEMEKWLKANPGPQAARR